MARILSRNDQKNWRVISVHLSDIVNSHKGLTAAEKRNIITDYHEKGYSAIQLSSDLLERLSDGLIEETLSNMTLYSRASNRKGSTFVFQEVGKASSAPILSETRYVNTHRSLLAKVFIISYIFQKNGVPGLRFQPSNNRRN
jgi:hypothetical protein